MRRGRFITNDLKGYNRIMEMIQSGKKFYFENSFEEIALKYIPVEPGREGKYFAKFFGQDEYEIDRTSNVVCEGLMEGRIIRKSRYDTYHLIKHY